MSPYQIHAPKGQARHNQQNQILDFTGTVGSSVLYKLLPLQILYHTSSIAHSSLQENNLLQKDFQTMSTDSSTVSIL